MTRKNIPHINNDATSNGIISVAPMMDWTDRHCRYFHRLLHPTALLYTEMVTTGALIHGDRDRFLRYNQIEHPVALQLGGSSPDDLALAAKMGEDAGYDEINLNCGCPSDRVQSGSFGAILMKSPDLVARCVEAMQKNVSPSLPVTVKCRIAIDDEDEEPFLKNFLDIVSQSGCTTFIIHARKAWLKGLSPKENRDIPPLNYDLVEHIQNEYPHLSFHLNGGLADLDNIHWAASTFKGAMIGRAAYQSPSILRDIALQDPNIDPATLISIPDIISQMDEYAKQQYRDYGTPLKSITRHMIGLFQAIPGARAWRQAFSPPPDGEALAALGPSPLRQIHDNIFGEIL